MEGLEWNPDSFTQLFLIGSIAFWVLLLVEFILLYVCVEFEQHILALLSVGVVLLAVHLLGDANLPLWFKNNPWTAAGYVTTYFFAGAVVSLIAWLRYVRITAARRLKHYQKLVESIPSSIEAQKREIISNKGWIKSSKSDVDTARYNKQIEAHEKIILELQKAQAEQKLVGPYLENLWYNECHCKHYDRHDRSYVIEKPNHRNHVSMLITWIAYWPPVLTWMLINDPVRFAAEQIYHSMDRLFAAVTNFAWKDPV